MDWPLLNILVFALVGYSLMFALFKPQMVKYEKTMKFSFYMLPFLYIFGIYSCGALSALFILNNHDFIEELTIGRVLIPLACMPIIYLSYTLFNSFISGITVVICLIATTWIQPIDIGNAFTDISPLTIKIAAIILGTLFCLYNRIFNILPHTFVLPNIIILFGICILGFIGASPLYVAVCAALLCGILSAYLYINFYEVKIEFDDGTCAVVAYLIYVLLLMNLGEYSFASCFIFTMIFWAELLAALWNKYIIFRSGYLAENTNFYLAAQQFSVPALTYNILRVCVIILFIGWFQLFSSNQYSLMIVAMFFSLWLCYSLGHPNNNAHTFKEINKEFVKDLKQNIAETKEIFTRHNKDE